MNDALHALPQTPEDEAELKVLEQGRGTVFRDMLRLVLHWAKQRGIYGALPTPNVATLQCTVWCIARQRRPQG